MFASWESNPDSPSLRNSLKRLHEDDDPVDMANGPTVGFTEHRNVGRCHSISGAVPWRDRTGADNLTEEIPCASSTDISDDEALVSGAEFHPAHYRAGSHPIPAAQHHTS